MRMPNFQKAINLLNIIAWIETHPKGYVGAECKKCGSKEVTMARYFQLSCEHCGETKNILKLSAKAFELEELAHA